MKRNTATVLLQSFTPAEIVVLLDNTDKYFRQRTPSTSTVNRYKHDMQSGNWFVETGDTIKLARENGREIVIDGQHRLKAAMHSKDPIYFWVFRYVPKEAFKFLDQGNPRTLKDIYDIHNEGWEKQPAVLASASMMLWKASVTGSPARRPESQDFEAPGNIADFVMNSYPELPDVLVLYTDELQAMQRGGIGGKAWMLYLLFFWSVKDDVLCREVLEYLVTRGEYQTETARLAKAIEAGRRVELIEARIEEIKSRESFTTQYSILEEAVCVVKKFRDGQRDKSTGKIFKTRNKDVSDFTMFAYQLAWNSIRDGNVGLTGYRSLLRAAIKSNTYDEIPEAI